MNTHQPNPFCRRLRAFTLVEMLIASGIAVAVMLIIAMVYSNAINAWTRGNAVMQTAQSARTALDLLDRDLRSLSIVTNAGMPPVAGLNYNEMYYTNAGIGFYASVPNPTQAWDICRVEYYVDENTLKRRLTYALTPGSTAIATSESDVVINLWQGAAGFSLSSFQHGSATPTISPIGTTAIPSRITVTLKLSDTHSIRRGATFSPNGTYETTIFLPQGIR